MTAISHNSVLAKYLNQKIIKSTTIDYYYEVINSVNYE